MPVDNFYAMTNSVDKSARMYLRVPFADKDEVKSRGARFDMSIRQWYIAGNADIELFVKWLDIPYEDKCNLAMLYTKLPRK